MTKQRHEASYRRQRSFIDAATLEQNAPQAVSDAIQEMFGTAQDVLDSGADVVIPTGQYVALIESLEATAARIGYIPIE